MEKTEQNVLKNIPDCHTTTVRENWNTEQGNGKTRPEMPNKEVQTCNPQNQ